MPGILEVNAVEYYANETEDDIQEGIVGGLLEPIEDPNAGASMSIVGDTFIKVKKTYQEQIDTCPAERTDLLALYNENMEYINFYAPKEVSEKEVCNCVYEKFMELKSANKRINIGLMMKALMPELRGKADGKIINKYVTKILQENGIR